MGTGFLRVFVPAYVNACNNTLLLREVLQLHGYRHALAYIANWVFVLAYG